MDEAVNITVVRALTLRHRVERCVFSIDGKRIAVCLGDYSVRVYETSSAHAADGLGSPAHACSSSPAHSLNFLCSLKGHGSNVWSASFSGDGSLLCSCSSDRTVRVWHLERQENLFTHSQHSDTVWCCSFAHSPPDHVVSGSSDKTVKIWNYRTGEIVQNLTAYDGPVETLSFSKDWTRLCTGSRDGRIVVWSNIFTGEAPTYVVLFVAESWIWFVSFSSFCSNLLATSGNHNAILVWDLDKVFTYNTSSEAVDSVSNVFTSDGVRTLVKTFKPLLVLQGHLNTVWDSCFAQIRRLDTEEVDTFLVSCSGDRSIRFWELSSGMCVQETQLEREKDSQLMTCSFSPVAHLLVVGTFDGSLLAMKMTSLVPRPAPKNGSFRSVLSVFRGGSGNETRK